MPMLYVQHAGDGAAGTSSNGEGAERTDLGRYNVPHLPYLTPPNMRKGKGGRQPAIDPRLVSVKAQHSTAQHSTVGVSPSCTPTFFLPSPPPVMESYVL